MGSGKSALGRLLAGRLRWEFLDTDRLIEEREGRSIQRIFDEDGEARFRQIESEVLETLEGRRALVVAAGGGLFLDAGNRRRLKRFARTVWLDVPFEVCASRVGEGAGRPLWNSADPAARRRLFDLRAPVYALAEARLRAGARPADELVGEVLGIFD